MHWYQDTQVISTVSARRTRGALLCGESLPFLYSEINRHIPVGPLLTMTPGKTAHETTLTLTNRQSRPGDVHLPT